jgi:leader peptidase (prepilin peptidase)/N-methyltransferase
VVVALSGFPTWLGEVYAAILGLVVGSFLAVCIRRLPEDRSLLVPSACPHCGHRVRWHDNVPVLSWLVLRGRCRDCGAPISPSYPLVELLTGLLAWLLFRRTFQAPTDFDLGHLVLFLADFVFVGLLIVATYVDLRHRIIPDQVSIYAVPVGLAFAALGSWVGGAEAVGFRAAVLGALFWGGLFALISWTSSFVFRVEALGWGDVKLVTMFGAFLGGGGTWIAVLLGSIAGAIAGIAATAVHRRRVHLPFGPPLALGALGYVLFGHELLIGFELVIARALGIRAG